MAASASQTLRSVLHEIAGEIGKEEYSIVHLEETSDMYGMIPRIPSDQIYKETMLSRVNFLKDYKIRTLEETFSLANRRKDLYFLSRDTIRRHQSKYNYLHIGLVQVSIAPLGFARRDDDKVLICLRDAKCLNFRDSVLAAFESSVHDARFNWFPNFSSSLSDLANSNGLVVTVEPHGYHLAEGFEDSHILALEYRMCYKLMKTSSDPKSFFRSPLIEVNTEKTNVLVPKSTKDLKYTGLYPEESLSKLNAE